MLPKQTAMRLSLFWKCRISNQMVRQHPTGSWFTIANGMQSKLISLPVVTLHQNFLFRHIWWEMFTPVFFTMKVFVEAKRRGWSSSFHRLCEQMRNVLRLNPINIDRTIIDTVYSLIEKGFIKKTSHFQSKPISFSAGDVTINTFNLIYWFSKCIS